MKSNKKSKTELEKEEELIKSLLEEINKKIRELGEHDFVLYDALTKLQNLFDKIINVPTDKLTLYERTKNTCSLWMQQVKEIERNYGNANTNIGGAGVAAGAGTAAVGTGIALFGSSAAMGIATTFGVTSTGVAISSLHGYVATNAALAWLGGGALSAGGGGIAFGKTLLGFMGPVGLSIACAGLVLTGILFWKAISAKETLEKIFLSIYKRDQDSYKLAIAELSERIEQIKDRAVKLKDAISKIQTFGLDYTKMTEEQQRIFGEYIDLMDKSVQLLVNPILNLQPKVTQEDLEAFLNTTIPYSTKFFCEQHKDLVVYMANFLYKIDIDESKKKLLSKSFKGNKNFKKSMNLKKRDLDVKLFDITETFLNFIYI